MEKEKKIELPEAFVKKMEELLGSDAEPFFESYDVERKFGLRVNPLKRENVWMAEAGTPLEEYLRGLAKVPWAKEGFYYEADMRPGRHPFHEAGAYYIQEPSAMSTAEALAPKPGERILDLCAAPGGKSTHLAGKMGGQGLLVCNEIHPVRAKILSQNIERLGIGNAVVTNMDPFQLAPAFPEFFDGIVVDAPCSGEGMFRKDENARNEWSPDHVKQCAGLQDGILDCAAAMLKDGGRIAYSTCTFSPEENEQSVARFLSRHPGIFCGKAGTCEVLFSRTSGVGRRERRTEKDSQDLAASGGWGRSFSGTACERGEFRGHCDGGRQSERCKDRGKAEEGQQERQ